MTAPRHCPLCLKENVVATMGGPTCRHQPKSGLAWFPEWWTGSFGDPVIATEQKRADYMQQQQAAAEFRLAEE